MTKVFDAYAAYYDLIYNTKDYQAESDYVASLLEQYAPSAQSLLEMGCGTGGHAQHLAGKYRLLGIDRSDVMLQRANERRANLPENLKEKLEFIHGDVTTFRMDKKFDAVISLFHVMSYMVENKDLEAAFETAAAHLNPGGVFIFDYWFGPAVLSQKPEVRVRRMENEEVRAVRIAEPIMHLDKNFVQINFTVQVNTKHDDISRTLDERHDMRYLFHPEIEHLSNRWFQVKAHYGWMKKECPTLDDWAGVTVLERL